MMGAPPALPQKDIDLARRTVAAHANDPDTRQCRICHVSRCNAFADAITRLILAGVDPRPPVLASTGGLEPPHEPTP